MNRIKKISLVYISMETILKELDRLAPAINCYAKTQARNKRYYVRNHAARMAYQANYAANIGLPLRREREDEEVRRLIAAAGPEGLVRRIWPPRVERLGLVRTERGRWTLPATDPLMVV